MTRVRIAVIGLGFMGSRWARAFAEHPGARLAVVNDVREDLADEFAASFGARHVRDALDVASHPDVDGVVVCTPEDVHAAPALAALEAGKPTAVEKPLAHTIEDAERIRERARERGIPVLAGHILRFETRYAAIARAVHAGEIGAVQAIRSERIGLVSDQDVLKGRTSIALYYGVHEFDVARWYAGEVARVVAERSRGVLDAHGYEIDDLYSALVTFRSGAHGTAMIGWSLPRSMPGYGLGGFTVIGEHGVLRVEQGEVGVLQVGKSGVRSLDAYYAPEVRGRLRGALQVEVDHFVDVVRGVAEPACTPEDATEALRISLAMERSAQTGTAVDL